MRLVGRTRRQFCILACRLEKAKSFQVTDSAFFVVDFDGGGGGGGVLTARNKQENWNFT